MRRRMRMSFDMTIIGYVVRLDGFPVLNWYRRQTRLYRWFTRVRIRRGERVDG